MSDSRWTLSKAKEFVASIIERDGVYYESVEYTHSSNVLKALKLLAKDNIGTLEIVGDRYENYVSTNTKTYHIIDYKFTKHT